MMFGPVASFPPSFNRNGVILLKLAAVYLIAGLGLGLFMAMTGDVDLRPVHTHANLLGWVTMGLSGLIYCAFPHLGETRMAAVHVGLHAYGLPVMLIALALYSLGHTEAEPFLGVAAIVTTAGLLMFALNLWRGITAPSSGAAPESAETPI